MAKEVTSNIAVQMHKGIAFNYFSLDEKKYVRCWILDNFQEVSYLKRMYKCIVAALELRPKGTRKITFLHSAQMIQAFREKIDNPRDRPLNNRFLEMLDKFRKKAVALECEYTPKEKNPGVDILAAFIDNNYWEVKKCLSRKLSLEQFKQLNKFDQTSFVSGGELQVQI